MYVQAMRHDPRVTQTVKDLNECIARAANDSGVTIPAVLVLNKVSSPHTMSADMHENTVIRSRWKVYHAWT